MAEGILKSSALWRKKVAEAIDVGPITMGAPHTSHGKIARIPTFVFFTPNSSATTDVFFVSSQYPDVCDFKFLNVIVSTLARPLPAPHSLVGAM